MAFIPFATTIFKNLFSKPATRLYPITVRQPYARTRGHIEIDGPACIFCGMCDRKCPTHAIAVVKNDKSWTINRLRCIQCNSCVEVCPKKCLTMDYRYTPPTAGPSIDSFNA
jgi:ech hydrogenase subunit F